MRPEDSSDYETRREMSDILVYLSDILVYLNDRVEKPRGDRHVLFANIDMSKKKIQVVGII